MLLIDYDKGVSINRAYYEGDRFEADALLSLYGEDDLEWGTFSWTLSRAGRAVLSALPVERLATGGVTTLARVELVWPKVTETTRFNLSFSLKGNLASISNDWDFWVFARPGAPAVAAAADQSKSQTAWQTLCRPRAACGGARPEAGDFSSPTSTGLEHLKSGGDLCRWAPNLFRSTMITSHSAPGWATGSATTSGPCWPRSRFSRTCPMKGGPIGIFIPFWTARMPFVIDEGVHGPN